MTVWLQLSAGHGPPECAWVVARLLDARAAIGPQWKAVSELMRVSGELTQVLVLKLRNASSKFALLSMSTT